MARRHNNVVWVGLPLAMLGIALFSRRKASPTIKAGLPPPRSAGQLPPSVSTLNPQPEDPSNGVKQLNELQPVPSRLAVSNGQVGMAEVEVPFLVSALVTASALRSGLEAKGLQPITISQTRPANWPSNNEADWYVSAKSLTTQTLDVPSAVTRVWVAS